VKFSIRLAENVSLSTPCERLILNAGRPYSALRCQTVKQERENDHNRPKNDRPPGRSGLWLAEMALHLSDQAFVFLSPLSDPASQHGSWSQFIASPMSDRPIVWPFPLNRAPGSFAPESFPCGSACSRSQGFRTGESCTFFLQHPETYAHNFAHARFASCKHVAL